MSRLAVVAILLAVLLAVLVVGVIVHPKESDHD